MTESEHPQQYDLGEAVQLDSAETLTGDPNEDPLDAGLNPPDRPISVDRNGVTPDDQQGGRSWEDRLAEEEPDGEQPTDPDRVGRLVAPDQGLGPDEEKDVVASDVGYDGGAASAEEAAIHEIDPLD